MADLSIGDRVLLLEVGQAAVAEDFQELKVSQKDHRDADDKRFTEVNLKLDGLKNLYIAILGSVTTACVLLLINAAILITKG